MHSLLSSRYGTVNWPTSLPSAGCRREVANCIHGAAEVIAPLPTGMAHGILASFLVLTQSYARFIVNWMPQPTVLTALGIGQYPLQSLNR